MGDVKWRRAIGKRDEEGTGERKKEKRVWCRGEWPSREEQLVMQGKKDNCGGSPWGGEGTAVRSGQTTQGRNDMCRDSGCPQCGPGSTPSRCGLCADKEKPPLTQLSICGPCLLWPLTSLWPWASCPKPYLWVSERCKHSLPTYGMWFLLKSSKRISSSPNFDIFTFDEFFSQILAGRMKPSELILALPVVFPVAFSLTPTQLRNEAWWWLAAVQLGGRVPIPGGRSGSSPVPSTKTTELKKNVL